MFNGRHVSRQPAKAVGTSGISQSTRMKKQEETVSSAARNTTVHNGSVCSSYYKEEGREGRLQPEGTAVRRKRHDNRSTNNLLPPNR